MQWGSRRELLCGALLLSLGILRNWPGLLFLTEGNAPLRWKKQ